MAFNWSDHARAIFSFCLPCLYSTREQHDNDNERAHAARRDELESLLQDANVTDTEMDADALSLHSHIGRQDGRKRVKRARAKNKRSITLFGFDLFGRPRPDVEDDDERPAPSRVSRISSSTLDSDAAPLADDAIAQLSAQTQARRAADEARRARKRQRRRREQKAAARLGARDDAFEGFQGSGAPAAPDDFGAFQQAGREFVDIRRGGPDEEAEDADADFDAGSYVRTAAPRSDSGSGSGTRPQPHHVPLPPSSTGSHSPARPKRPKNSGKRSVATTSSATSQPRSPTSAVPAPHVDIASPSRDGFVHDGTFEGVPQDGDAFQASQALKRGLRLLGESVHGDRERFPGAGQSAAQGSDRFPSPGLGRSGGFPSLNLGGHKSSLSIGGQGAFLARTGEDP